VFISSPQLDAETETPPPPALLLAVPSVPAEEDDVPPPPALLLAEPDGPEDEEDAPPLPAEEEALVPPLAEVDEDAPPALLDADVDPPLVGFCCVVELSRSSSPPCGIKGVTGALSRGVQTTPGGRIHLSSARTMPFASAQQNSLCFASGTGEVQAAISGIEIIRIITERLLLGRLVRMPASTYFL
jgi:hypothetical protein